jgi:hypothetical protein
LPVASLAGLEPCRVAARFALHPWGRVGGYRGAKWSSGGRQLDHFSSDPDAPARTFEYRIEECFTARTQEELLDQLLTVLGTVRLIPSYENVRLGIIAKTASILRLHSKRWLRPPLRGTRRAARRPRRWSAGRWAALLPGWGGVSPPPSQQPWCKILLYC